MHRTQRPGRDGRRYAVPRYLSAAPLLALLLVPAPVPAAEAPAAESLATSAPPVGIPPPETPGIPSDAELEASGAVIGKILVDNQNIFNLKDPKDNNRLFRLADRLHAKTVRASSAASCCSRPVTATRAGCWTRPSASCVPTATSTTPGSVRCSYHDGKVDMRVTTRDVWTLNPGFNYGAQRRHQLHRRAARGR